MIHAFLCRLAQSLIRKHTTNSSLTAMCMRGKELEVMEDDSPFIIQKRQDACNILRNWCQTLENTGTHTHCSEQM